jgi:hypothetical protein
MADDTNKPAEPTVPALEKPVPEPAKPAKPRTARSTPAKSTTARKRAAPQPKAAAPASRTARKPAAAKPAAARKTPVPAKKADTTKKAVKPKKVKLVRDSFTMPENEYALIAELKKRCLAKGVPAKKSEILRAAVAGLAKLSDASVVATIRRLPVIKTGRPAKAAK